VGALDLAIGVMERGAKAKQQQLDLNGKEAEQLLGALERLTRASPAALALSEGPIERVRSGILLASALPALQVQAQGLSAQLAAVVAEHAHIDARRPEFDAARQALNKAREALAPLVAKRGDLIAKLLPPNDGKTPDIVKLSEQTNDLTDLIKHADADTDRRDKQLLARLRIGPAKKGVPPIADLTRPADLRALDAPRAAMVWPVVGDLSHRFGDADRLGRSSQGLSVSAPPAALVIAPFDGEVEFAGNFASYGLILIIRHRGGYHSVLAGLSRVDVTIGQWLLAGEPVGVMPGADDENASVTFYLELRRDGRPVDPQSRLASRE
jgi:septal ring factor EnvC (AmiA/AmiB activator)